MDGASCINRPSKTLALERTVPAQFALTSPMLHFSGIMARVETSRAGNFVPVCSQRVR